MEKFFRATLVFAALLLVCSVPVFAQQAIASGNVNLLRDPSTSSPVIVLLEAGSRLTLVEQTSSASTMENITRFHPGCHAKADLRGGDCLAAAHRYCEFYLKNSFGFLVERVGMNVYVACAPRAWYGDVSYADLRTLHKECRGVAEAAGPHCAAAVHRYCSNNQSLPGGLVQEIGPANVAIACFKPSRYNDVDYGTLKRFASGCGQPSDSGSLNCTTATAKWCKVGNAAESGLALEVGPKSLGVACMPAQTRVIAILDTAVRYDDN